MNAPVDRAALAAASLDDKYTLERGRVFLTGTQALIRLMMLQRERDSRAGLNTAGFVSGYRGSPLGGLDQALWRAKQHLESHDIRFQPGVNEDLAATAIWGTQQLNLFPKARFDGVFSMWYGKGPGVDRCGDVVMPPGGLNIRWPDGILEQEARILDYKVYAAIAYARANRLDRLIWDSPRARLGIITTGKSYGDVMSALADLGIDERVARDIGLRLYKVALSWPLEPQGARRFAEGLEEILVVEEKRQVIEYQIKEELYNWKEGMRAPRVVGKFDDNGEWSIAAGKPAGNWLLPAHYEHSPAMVARAIAQRLHKLGMTAQLGSQFGERLAFLDFKEKALARPRVTTVRQPYFCSARPHHTSTRVPEGSRATAGIGCHLMAASLDRSPSTCQHSV